MSKYAVLKLHYAFRGITNEVLDTSGQNNHGEILGPINIDSGATFNGYNEPACIKTCYNDSLEIYDRVQVSIIAKINDHNGMNGDISGEYIPNAWQSLYAQEGDRGGLSIMVKPYDDYMIVHAYTDYFGEKAGTKDAFKINLGDTFNIDVEMTVNSTILTFNGEKAETSIDYRKRDFEKINGNNIYIGRMNAEKESCREWWYPLNGNIFDLKVFN